MPAMKYYLEAEQKRQQQKYLKQQKQYIQKKDEAMLNSIKQIKCRTLRYCKNGDTQYCMYCKWNKTCIQPKDDFYKPKIPGIKVLP